MCLGHLSPLPAATHWHKEGYFSPIWAERKNKGPSSIGRLDTHLWPDGNSSWTVDVIYDISVEHHRWTRRGWPNLRRVGGQRPLTAPDLLNEKLLLTVLIASSSVIVNETLRYLISEWQDSSCTHKSASLQQESSIFTSLALSESKGSSTWKKKNPSHFPSQTCHATLFPFICYLLFFILCSPIIEVILLRQRQAEHSVASSSCFFISCDFVIRVEISFVLFERWLRTHLSWLFHF